MDIAGMLEELQSKALRDPKLREEILATEKEPDPLNAFCRKCRELGYEIYPMELVIAGEEFYASYRRSTNGGGENSPKLVGQDDFHEMFLASLKAAAETKAQGFAEQSDYNW